MILLFLSYQWCYSTFVKNRKKKALANSRSIVPLSRVVPLEGKLPRRFNAVVGRDTAGKPAWFLFDHIAFWELICRTDEKLWAELPDESYEKVTLGKIIDVLEREWPFSKEYGDKIRREYEKALEDVKAGRVRPF